MQIGIDASRYRHETPTGVELYSKEVIEGLVERFSRQKIHKILLYTPHLIAGFPESIQRILPEKRLWTQWHLSREMQIDPPDVLFIPSHVLPIRHPKKSLITIHDVSFRSFPKAYHPFQWLYLHWSTRFAVRHSWKILVPSTATGEDLERLYGCNAQKIEILPHGFTQSTLRVAKADAEKILKLFGLTPRSPYFFFVGRLESKKNLTRLIQAFKLFQAKHPTWKLVLAGKRGVGFASILKTLEKNALLQHVLMPGYLTEEEKQVLFQHARGFVFPSLSEGFGFPVLEAASYNLPILASSIPAFTSFKSFIDVFVDPLDVDDMHRGLLKLAKLKSTSKSHALEPFSWSKTIDRLYALLTHS